MQFGKRFKKYIILLLNISHRISVRRVDMAEWNNVLTSRYHNCNSKYSYPTSNFKKLFINYSIFLCSISKLYHYIRMFSIRNSELAVTYSELTKQNSEFNYQLNNFCRMGNKFNTLLNYFYGMENYFYD